MTTSKFLLLCGRSLSPVLIFVRRPFIKFLAASLVIDKLFSVILETLSPPDPPPPPPLQPSLLYRLAPLLLFISFLMFTTSLYFIHMIATTPSLSKTLHSHSAPPHLDTILPPNRTTSASSSSSSPTRRRPSLTPTSDVTGKFPFLGSFGYFNPSSEEEQTDRNRVNS